MVSEQSQAHHVLEASPAITVLYDRQNETNQGCYFVALYAYRHALGLPIPDSDTIWDIALNGHAPYDARMNTGFMIPGTRLVALGATSRAINTIHPANGLRLHEYSLNQTGEKIMGTQMRKTFGEPKVVSPTINDLAFEDLTLPFCVLMHQLGNGSDLHFVTHDGTKEAADAIAHFQSTEFNPIYRAIMTMNFQQI